LRDQAADFKKYGEQYSAHWTPTLLELDPDGHERTGSRASSTLTICSPS
jgi:hypothetical protein